MNARKRTTNFKFNKFFEFIAQLLLPYDWGYKMGVIEGLKKANYYKGYADGQEDGTKYAFDSQRNFFDNIDLRKTGKKK